MFLQDIMTPSGVRRVERILDVFKCTEMAAGPDASIIDACPGSPSLMSISESFLNADDSSLDPAADSMFL